MCYHNDESNTNYSRQLVFFYNHKFELQKIDYKLQLKYSLLILRGNFGDKICTDDFLSFTNTHLNNLKRNGLYMSLVLMFYFTT